MRTIHELKRASNEQASLNKEERLRLAVMKKVDASDRFGRKLGGGYTNAKQLSPTGKSRYARKKR